MVVPEYCCYSHIRPVIWIKSHGRPVSSARSIGKQNNSSCPAMRKTGTQVDLRKVTWRELECTGGGEVTELMGEEAQHSI